MLFVLFSFKDNSNQFFNKKTIFFFFFPFKFFFFPFLFFFYFSIFSFIASDQSGEIDKSEFMLAIEKVHSHQDEMSEDKMLKDRQLKKKKSNRRRARPRSSSIESDGGKQKKKIKKLERCQCLNDNFTIWCNYCCNTFLQFIFLIILF